MDKKSQDLVYGTRAIIETIKSGRSIERIYLQKGLTNALISELKKLARANNAAVSVVPLEKLDRITRKNHQGAVAFTSLLEHPKLSNVVMEVFESGKTPFFLILDRITDVRNFGAIARTAECAGVQAIIIPERGSALINEDAMKTSAGALNNIHIVKETKLEETVRYLINSGVEVVACTEKTDKSIYEQNYSGPIAIILGSEEDGISEVCLKLCSQKLKIPMFGQIESLNVSVSAGIILYQVVRDRLV